MKRNVYLDGELAEKYGEKLVINADSFADVFRCLECNFPDIREYLIECHEKDIGFLCEIEDSPLTREEDLIFRMEEGDMYITPVPAGSSGGFGKILAAAAILVVVGLAFASGGSLAWLGAQISTFGFASTVSYGLGLAAGSFWGVLAIGLAVNLAITGIQELLAPDPATDSQQDESYLFQGAEQNVVEGDPIPIVYGRLRIPGRPISFEMRNSVNVIGSYDASEIFGGGAGGGGQNSKFQGVTFNFS